MHLLVIRASFCRALREYTRYPSWWKRGLFWNPIQFILPFLFLAETLGGKNNESIGFVFIGSICWSWLHNLIWDTATLIQRESKTGTLESVFLSPASRWAWLVGSVSAPTLTQACVLTVASAFTYLLFPFPLQPHWTLVLAYSCIVLGFGWSLSFATSAIVLYLKQATNVLSVFVDMTSTLSGTTFPIDKAPGWLLSLAMLVPFSPAINGLRRALLGTVDWSQEFRTVLALVLVAIVMLSVGLYLHATVERQVRRNASLHTY